MGEKYLSYSKLTEKRYITRKTRNPFTGRITEIKAKRNYYKPDIHSFFIKINGGKAYVEGQYGGVYIREYYDDGTENAFHGTAVAATNRLIMLGADYDTLEM